MQKKQSAVSYIDNEIIKHSILYRLSFEDQMEIRRIITRAKKKEKEQIMDAYRFPNTFINQSSEDYYNETYGSI